MANLWDGLLNLIWPADCFVCGAQTVRPGFCDGCAALIEPRPAPRCASCDASLPVAAPAHRCGRCLHRTPGFERAFGVFDYAGPVGDAIRAGKYGRRPAAIDAVARALVAQLPAALRDEPPSAVVPIPLHRRRLAARGFSPPLVLAHAAARALGVPLRRRALLRSRDTPEQAGLDDQARRRNMRGAFAARGPLAGDVLLVDDVMTTGATVDAAARAARAAGAKRVRVLCAAYVDRSL